MRRNLPLLAKSYETWSAESLAQSRLVLFLVEPGNDLPITVPLGRLADHVGVQQLAEPSPALPVNARKTIASTAGP